MALRRFTLDSAARARLSDRLQSEGLNRRGPRRIPRVDGDTGPVAPAQERFLFWDGVSDEHASYAISVGLDLDGPLDVDALRTAFAALSVRHAALRTTFFEGPEPGAWQQRVLPELAPEWSEVDARWAAKPEEEVLADIESTLTGRRFDLGQGPLIRGRLVRLASTRSTLLVTVHHAIADRWSMGILARDLLADYATAIAGGAVPTPAHTAAPRYLDVASWQRSPEVQQPWSRDLDYWTDVLADAQWESGLISPRPRPARKTYAGASVPIDLDDDLIGGVRALARTTNATTFMVLTAAVCAAIGAIAGTEDLTVATPVSGRTHPETEEVVGLFINTVVVRADLSGSPSGHELVKRVRDRTLAALAHADVPFERVVDRISPPRSAAHTPLFSTIVSVQSSALQPWSGAGLTVTPTSLPGRKAETDLLFDIVEEGARAWGRLEYSTDLFTPEFAEALRALVVRVLRQLVAHPERQVHAHRLHGAVAAPPQPIDAIPDWSADDDATLVAHLSRRLSGLGVAADVPVAVALPADSAGFRSAVRAIWSAGAVMVPGRSPESLLATSPYAIIVDADHQPGDTGDALVVDMDSGVPPEGVASTSARPDEELAVAVPAHGRLWGFDHRALTALGDGDPLSAVLRIVDPATDSDPLLGSLPVGTARLPGIAIVDESGRRLPDGFAGRLAPWGIATPILLDDCEQSPPPTDGTATYISDLLARTASDGTVEHLGRASERDTVCGYPVRLADVRRAFETIRSEDGTPAAARVEWVDGRIRAVVVAPGRERADISADLAEVLPAPALPADLAAVDTLPPADTPLHAALFTDDPASSAGTAPRTDTERRVHGIWARLLHRADFGVDVSFFELGGHSLLLAKVAAAVHEEFGVRIVLRTLFERPTVESIALAIAMPSDSGTPIDTVSRDRPIPLSFAQEELVAHQPVSVRDPFHNVVTALDISGSLDVAALGRTLDDITRRHDALRTRLEEVGHSEQHPSGWAQRICAEAEWPLVLVDATADPAALRRVLDEEKARCFRVTDEPLVRAVLVRTAQDHHVLVKNMHHLVTDNWSYGVLVSEMRNGYAAHTGEVDLVRPAPAPSFPDLAAHEQDQLRSGACDPQIRYWRDRLAGLPSRPELAPISGLPAAAPASVTTGFRLLPATARAVAETAGDARTTSFSVFMAAYAIALSAFGRTDEVTIDFPVAGRDRPESAPVIGYLVNHLLLRLLTHQSDSFADIVRRVRDAALDAQANQGVPVWRVVDLPSRPNPFGYSLNLLNADVPGFELPGVEVTPWRSDRDGTGSDDDYVFEEVVITFDPAAVDLALILRPAPDGGLNGMWLTAIDRVDPMAAAQLINLFPPLVAALCASPESAVATILGDLDVVGAEQTIDCDGEPA